MTGFDSPMRLRTISEDNMLQNKKETVEYVKGIKFWLERARGYLLWFNVIMIFDIWKSGRDNISFGTILLIGIPIALLVMYIDYRWIWRWEASASTKTNPEWLEKWDVLMKEISEIKESIKKNEKTNIT